MRKLMVLAAMLAMMMVAAAPVGLGLPRFHGLFAFKPRHLLSV